jgi:hypothetical protein
VAGPLIFGLLIESGSCATVFAGYAFAALLMIAAAFVALRHGVAAERKPLEQGGAAARQCGLSAGGSCEKLMLQFPRTEP